MPLFKKLAIWCGIPLGVCATLFQLLVVLVVGYCAYDEYYVWPRRGIAESQRRGDHIVARLERYYERNGRYPDELTALIPTEFKTIEQPCAGTRRWTYRVFEDNQAFDLSFGTSQHYPCCNYHRSRNDPERGGEWHEDR